MIRKILTLLILVILSLASFTYAQQVGGPYGINSYAKSMADNVVTPIFNVSLPDGRSTGGQIIYTIHVVGNLWDLQAHSGTVLYVGVNKGGVYTTDILHIAILEAEASSAGTLTDTWTITTGSNEIILNLNTNTSLTPVSMIMYYHILRCCPLPITPQ